MLDGQEEIVRSTTFRYITDVITKEEALQLLREKDAGRKERESKVREIGCAARFSCKSHLMIFFAITGIQHMLHPLDGLVRCNASYTYQRSKFHSAGYSDEKIVRLTKEAIAGGFNHFKMKVGANVEDDLRRGKLIRSIIDDPQHLPPSAKPLDPKSEELRGKNAGPTGSVLMIDANQVWDVPQAIEYVTELKEIKPW